MKTYLASLMLMAACTSNSGSSEPGAMMAADIRYDNASTGLMSTNVQDALDDLLAMAQAQDERASRSMIVCHFATENLPLPLNGVPTPHVFTQAECGGTLPDASYIGALASFETCTEELRGIRIKNAGEADGPGFVVRRGYTVNSYSCTGPAEVTAIFYKKS